MSSDEGSNGNKRKTEESAGGSPKRVHLADDEKQTQTNIYASSTFSGITQDDQASKNVGGKDWMRHCDVHDYETKPQCTKCKEYHSFHIESTTFKDHFDSMHQDIYNDEIKEIDIKNEPDWIFRYFDLGKIAQNLECKLCTHSIEVQEFKGRFIDHFNKKHKVEPTSQGGYEDAEEVKRFTKIFIYYLYYQYVNNDTKEGTSSSEEEIKQDEEAPKSMEGNNWITYCDLISGAEPQCTLCKKHYPFYIASTIFDGHLKNEHRIDKPDKEIISMDWIFRHFVPVDQSHFLKCEICNKEFEVQKFEGPFIEHFNKEHKDQPGYGTAYKSYFVLFIEFFLGEYLTKGSVRDTKVVGEKKIWWMRYIRKVEENKVYCFLPKCSEEDKFVTMGFSNKDYLESHIQKHLQEQHLLRNPDNSEYLSFKNCVLRCKICDKRLSFSFSTNFTCHLKVKHGIIRENQGESSQQTDINIRINNHLKTLMKNLIKKM